MKVSADLVNYVNDLVNKAMEEVKEHVLVDLQIQDLDILDDMEMFLKMMKVYINIQAMKDLSEGVEL